MKIKRIYLIFWLLLSFIILIIEPISIDDVYNYSFAQNIKNGLIPYLDFNMIVTPLSSYLTALFLIFFDNIFIIKILWFLCTIIVYYFIYNIFKNFIKNNFENIMISSVIALITSYFSMFSYNLIALCLILFSCNYLINLIDKDINIKNIIILGLISVLTILTKQTTGIILLFTNLFILSIILIKNKCTFKKYVLSLIVFIIEVIFILLCFLLILFLNDSLKDFFEQTLFGISTFNQKHIIISIAWICLIISVIAILFIYYYAYKKNRDLKYIILMIFAISQSVIMYPLPNSSHVALGITIFIILLYIFLVEIFNKYYIITKLCVIIFGIIICYITNSIFKENNVVSKQKYFYGNFIEYEVENNMNLLNKYIEDNNGVYYMITENAMILNMNKDIYYKYYDLFFYGNLGTQDPVELIKKIENDYLIIYSNADNDFWQTPEDALKYIRDLEKVNEIGPYSIYTKVLKDRR